MAKKFDFDSGNTLVNTIVGILGTIVSSIGIWLTYSDTTPERRESLDVPIRIGLVLSGILFISYVLLLIFRHFYAERRKRLCTTYVAYPNQRVMTTGQVKSLDVTRLNLVAQKCFNRIDNDEIAHAFWQSSWLGAGTFNTLTDKINSVPIYEGQNPTGKIPIIVESFEDKQVHVLEIKYEHYLGGHWAAVIHGKYGKPVCGSWKTCYNLNDYSYISFWAKTCNDTILPEQEPDNVYGYPIFYVQFADMKRVRSDSVLITVPTNWKPFKIALTKFLYDTDLYRDYNENTKRQYFEGRDTFKPHETIQLEIGSSEVMDAQAGTLHLYDIRFL